MAAHIMVRAMPNRPMLLIALLLANCAPRPAPAAAPIDAAAIARHVEILASDAYQGRAPGTQGETMTVEYLVTAMGRQACGPATGQAGFRMCR